MAASCGDDGLRIKSGNGFRQPQGVHPGEVGACVDDVVVFVVSIHQPVGALGQEGFEFRHREPAADGGHTDLLGDRGQSGYKGSRLTGSPHGDRAAAGPGAFDENAGRQEGQPIEIPLAEAGDAIRGGGEVDGAIGEAVVSTHVFRPHRSDWNHIRINAWIGEARSAGELVEAVARSSTNQHPLGSERRKLIAKAVAGGGISPVKAIAKGEIHRGDVVGGSIGIHPLQGSF